MSDNNKTCSVFEVIYDSGIFKVEIRYEGSKLACNDWIEKEYLKGRKINSIFTSVLSKAEIEEEYL